MNSLSQPIKNEKNILYEIPPKRSEHLWRLHQGGGANGDLEKYDKNAHKCKKYDKPPILRLISGANMSSVPRGSKKATLRCMVT